MPFQDSITNETTPKRMYALMKLVQYQSFKKSELAALLQPPGLIDGAPRFNKVYSLAKAGNLIQERSDGVVESNMDTAEIATAADFRRAIAKRVFQDDQLLFSRFTAWYIMRGPKVLTESMERLEQELKQEMQSTEVYNDTNITAWRTWAAFLGEGYVHNKILVPNAAVRLQDLLAVNTTLNHDKRMPFREFMQWLHEVAPELDGGRISLANKGATSMEKQHLSWGLSAGLRALHDQGKVVLRYEPDTKDTWYLQEVVSHDIPFKVSEITIRG